MSVPAPAAPVLSAVVAARNEEPQLGACLARLAPADEIVVVLDRTTDNSGAIAQAHGARVVEGEWPIEGDRRNAALDAASGDWILEVDADERVPEALFAEIRRAVAVAAPGYFLVPFDNYVGDRLVRHGWGASWGVGAAPRLSSRGAKRWGRQRVHPRLTLSGPKRRLRTPIAHYVDRDVNDMLARLARYTDAHAADLREAGALPPLRTVARRAAGRFVKCYWRRKGYREGGLGLVIASMAALYPLLSRVKAEIEPGEDSR